MVLLELDFNITIVGLGLIGGSFAMALKELNPKNLWAVDIDEEVIKTAEKMKIIDKGYTNPEIPLKKSDIVITCIYPNLTVKFIRDNMENFKSGAIITDTAGIKEKLVREICATIREDVDFIGGHPMAGRESKGLGFATKDIFNNANYLITPTDKNKEENIKKVEELVEAIGFKNIVKLDCKQHDEIIAFTSHLPHIVASALINSDSRNDTKFFVAGGYKDATRVARINEELWTELIMDNYDNNLKQIEIFENSIANFKRAIMNNDRESLKALFRKGSQKREELI
ncbi:prephenate dehydrogenase [Wukongibacter baidiensis]|uniref:prephenate dehydrogenase n=1 Tax=Wukongibacter baidiensis TaxID=1723361 RepID=UPI003D7F606D